ncbi:hypothetical protein [Luteipulveratus mongoliensis]|uniref:Uncharacterized protein n=1 Tax=Luteipulveratus mongoliensis TaxID=571913 RepID=A0A0K1JE69_9MICO|nr:hypothetical protein [Luteipulveratus mongoliensis]AKU15012.1 hypothetical protein VV02_02605 [Luteipulveratus mongoliensis]
MPMRNRVTPLGEIVAIPLRGDWLGNRGILHNGRDIVRTHASALWIICTLSHKDWRLPQWQPHHFTVLFFHDEAVALAAGHRPCALCRREDYNAYRDAWTQALDVRRPLATEMDRRLHGERNYRGTSRRRWHPADWADLPTGAFVRMEEQPYLVLDDAIVPWTRQGYGVARPRPAHGDVELVTPPSTIAALRGGYTPQIHPTAHGSPA